MIGILVNAGIPYPARRNFTIAHELGHCKIETHLDPEYRCTSRSINAFDPKNPFEVEASKFAAELLIPESEFDRLAGRVSTSIEGIKEIADRFGTSLTATLIRYVKLSPDQCAIVLSDHNGIIWGIPSRRFPFEIRRGALSEHSFAIDFFTGKTLPSRGEPVLRSAWARDGAVRPEIPLFEESRQFERLGLVLTLLTVRASDDDEDGEEADSFED